jgi:hypothetical protein
MYCQIIKPQVFNFCMLYNGYVIIMPYDKNTHYVHMKYLQKNGIKIITTFNFNSRRTINVVVIYKFSILHIENFLPLLKCICIKAPHHCHIIFIGDFNVDI